MKTLLTNRKLLLVVSLVGFSLGVSGCAGQRTSTLKQPTPRVLASLELTDQGRMLLKRDRPDDAISVLERAINLNPTNGQNYFYLSEAWLMKENAAQAREFNHLAGIYLVEDVEWTDRVIEQRRRIQRVSDNVDGYE